MKSKQAALSSFRLFVWQPAIENTLNNNQEAAKHNKSASIRLLRLEQRWVWAIRENSALRLFVLPVLSEFTELLRRHVWEKKDSVREINHLFSSPRSAFKSNSCITCFRKELFPPCWEAAWFGPSPKAWMSSCFSSADKKKKSATSSHRPSHPTNAPLSPWPRPLGPEPHPSPLSLQAPSLFHCC